MDTFSFTPKERAVNFSKLEKDRFRYLIEKYKETLFSKKTDNISNVKKNKTWAAIHAEFNAGGEQPRTIGQLKAKFDNMKRNARKDASQERQSRIKTGGGPPAPPVNQETEWFRSVMPISMDGLPSVVDDDFIENQPTVSILNDSKAVISLKTPNQSIEVNDVHADEHKENVNPSENIIYTVPDTIISNDNVFDTKSPASLLRKPVSKSLRIRKRSHSDSKSFYELKSEVLKKSREQEEQIYNLKVKYMEEKRKEEREIHELQKNKLILELSLLEKNI